MLGLIGRDEHLAASAAGRRRLEEIATDPEASAAGSALAPFAAGKAAAEVRPGPGPQLPRATAPARDSPPNPPSGWSHRATRDASCGPPA